MHRRRYYANYDDWKLDTPPEYEEGDPEPEPDNQPEYEWEPPEEEPPFDKEDY